MVLITFGTSKAGDPVVDLLLMVVVVTTSRSIAVKATEAESLIIS